MPNFEKASSHNTNSSVMNNYSYTKIMALFNQFGNDGGIVTRSNRAVVSFQDTNSYEKQLQSLDKITYQSTAGCDLNAIFMPFKSVAGSISGMPGFHAKIPNTPHSPSGTVDFQNLLPFMWASGESSYIYDRYTAASGDALNGIVSSDNYYGVVDRYRDISNIRSIAFRGPMMLSGWGFDLDGNPVPSGVQASGTYPSGTKFWKGGKDRGWQLDPKDYITAPIDLRYDNNRHVWSAGGKFFFRVNLTVNGGASGVAGVSAATLNYVIYEEKDDGSNGNMLGSGVNVEKDRLFAAPVVAANKGIAYYGPKSVLRIWDTNEKYHSVGCGSGAA